MLKIFISGLSGKMGQSVSKIANDKNYIISNAIESCDVVIDFSHPNNLSEMLKSSIKFKKPIIIGTTGFSKKEENLIKKFGLLFLLLCLPYFIFTYISKGQHSFIELAVIGEKDHKIPEFSFINQDSVIVTNSDYEDNIYIANFIYTTCPTICPTMTINMRYIQNKLKIYPNIKFLSHTVNPEYDSPSVLKKYAQKMRIDESNFNFVTGDKNEIYDIAKSYFVNVSEDELAPGGFLHSEFLVIVDKEGRVRSGYSNFICNTCQATSKKYTLTCPSTGEKNTMKGNALGSYDGTKDFVIKDMINLNGKSELVIIFLIDKVLC